MSRCEFTSVSKQDERRSMTEALQAGYIFVRCKVLCVCVCVCGAKYDRTRTKNAR